MDQEQEPQRNHYYLHEEVSGYFTELAKVLINNRRVPKIKEILYIYITNEYDSRIHETKKCDNTGTIKGWTKENKYERNEGVDMAMYRIVAARKSLVIKIFSLNIFVRKKLYQTKWQLGTNTSQLVLKYTLYGGT